MAFPRMIDALVNGSTFEVYGDGYHSRGFTYVSDVVDASVLAMENAPAGAVYNVGGGDEVSMRRAIATLEAVSEGKLDVVFGPPVAGDQRRTRADTTRMQKALGWEPRVTFEDGFVEQWGWASARLASR
jgi:UDP-glucose 4-epimerase